MGLLLLIGQKCPGFVEIELDRTVITITLLARISISAERGSPVRVFRNGFSNYSNNGLSLAMNN